MEIPIDLRDDQKATFERAFAWQSDKTSDEVVQTLLQLAAEAWSSWLSGAKRYNTLTEQYTDWIEKMYEHLFPEETEAPSAQRLNSSFNVPYGKAQYIARVLNDRLTARQTEKALGDLKTKLREGKDEISEWGPELAQRGVDIKLFKPEEIQLQPIIEDLVHESPEDVDIPKRIIWGNLVVITITARTLRKVCARLGI